MDKDIFKGIILIVISFIALSTGINIIIIDVNKDKQECTNTVQAQIVNKGVDGKQYYSIIDIKGTQLRYEYTKGKIGDYVEVRTNNSITKVTSEWEYKDSIAFSILLITISIVGLLLVVYSILKSERYNENS